MKNKKKFIVFAIMLSFLFVNFTFSVSAAPPEKIEKEKKVDKTKKDKDPTVYIREKGKKYHKKNCKLVKEKKGIKLTEAVKLGYDPCKVCKPPELDPKIVKKLRESQKKDPKEKK